MLDPSPSRSVCTAERCQSKHGGCYCGGQLHTVKKCTPRSVRGCFKATVNRRTNSGRGTLPHTQYTPSQNTRPHIHTHVRPCIQLQPTVNSQASTFARPDRSSSDPAVRRPNGTIICNLCSDKTDHFRGK